MEFGETDAMIGQIIRAMVRQEVAAALGDRAPEPVTERFKPPQGPLLGVDPYSLAPFAEQTLREAGGGPLHASEMTDRIYELGFRHRRRPKYSDQLERSLNSLASPSHHPDIFERVAPRTLKLRRRQAIA
ncbi:MAG TPA: hypothetical protein VLL27_00890 [Solirubrobacterales bacterium]|nr:hypothetical protein [Solirubrobacterales bacterium]